MEFPLPIDYILETSHSLHLLVINWIIDLRTFQHPAFLSCMLISGSAISNVMPLIQSHMCIRGSLFELVWNTQNVENVSNLVEMCSFQISKLLNNFDSLLFKSMDSISRMCYLVTQGSFVASAERVQHSHKGFRKMAMKHASGIRSHTQ